MNFVCGMLLLVTHGNEPLAFCLLEVRSGLRVRVRARTSTYVKGPLIV